MAARIAVTHDLLFYCRKDVDGRDMLGYESAPNVHADAAILIKVFKHGKLEILDGFGHLPEVETPDTVKKMLRDFFAN
jgi:hypothetical protein